MARQQVFLDDMDFELAKAPAEGDVLRLGEALVAKAHDDVVVEGPLDLAENSLVDRRRQIELDLRAAGGVGFAYRDQHGKRLNATFREHKAPTLPQPTPPAARR